MSTGDAPALEPEVEAACVVCGRMPREMVCDEAEVRAQLEYLERFHRHRLRPRRNSGDDELADRSAFTQDYTTAIVRCSFCGLILRQSRPRDSEVTEAYEQDRYGQDRLEALHDSQLELSRAKASRVARLLSGRAEPRIIEIGSFVGGFLAAARERGWSALGIDPGEEVAAFCRAKGLEVLPSTAEDAAIEEASADLVAVWNTFDQIPEPRPTLEAIRRWLRPGGMLAVRVPNGASFRESVSALRRAPAALHSVLLAAMAWNNLLGFPYLHGYSVETLDRLVAPFGFERIAVDPDTLTRLADADTKAWAAWEERFLKGVWRSLSRAHAVQPPWLDVHYRRT